MSVSNTTFLGRLVPEDSHQTRELMNKTAQWSQLPWGKGNRRYIVASRGTAFLSALSALKDIPVYLICGTLKPVVEVSEGKFSKACKAFVDNLEGALRSTALAVSLAVTGVFGCVNSNALEHLDPGFSTQKKSKDDLRNDIRETTEENQKRSGELFLLQREEQKLNGQLRAVKNDLDLHKQIIKINNEEAKELSQKLANLIPLEETIVELQRRLAILEASKADLNQEITRLKMIPEGVASSDNVDQPTEITITENGKKVIQEWLTTEIRHTVSLTIIKSLILKSLDESQCPNFPLTAYEKEVLSQSLPALNQLQAGSQKLVSQLQLAKGSPERIFSILANNKDYFTSYQQAMESYTRVLTLYNASLNSNLDLESHFAKRLDFLASNEVSELVNIQLRSYHQNSNKVNYELSSSDFSAFGMKFIQRPMRYQMMITELVKSCELKTTPAIVSQMTELNRAINELQRHYETFGEGVDLLRLLYDHYLNHKSPSDIQEKVRELPNITLENVNTMLRQIPEEDRIGSLNATLKKFIKIVLDEIQKRPDDYKRIKLPDVAAIDDESGVTQIQALLRYWLDKEGSLTRAEFATFREAVLSCPNTTALVRYTPEIQRYEVGANKKLVNDFFKQLRIIGHHPAIRGEMIRKQVERFETIATTHVS